MPEGFQLLSSGVAAIVEGIFVFFNVVNNYKYARVFKLLAYLGAGAYTTVLLKGLCACNLSLLKRPSYFRVTAFHKVSVEFLFRLL